MPLSLYVSIWRIKKSLGLTVLEIGIANDSSKETAHIIRDQQQVADKLPLVVVEPHVVHHISLAVGQEQEVCVVCTLLTADPHNPDENKIEVGQEHVLKVQHPQDCIDNLDNSG